MSKKPLSFFKLSLIAIGAVLGLVLLFSIFGSWHISPNLPDLPEDVQEGESAENPDYVRLDVNRENVKSVVSALNRPSSYYTETKCELFYDDKSTSFLRRRWVKEAVSRVDILNTYGNITMSVIMNSENAYYWYSGAARYITLPKGEFAPENEQMMMDYTDLLKASDEAIVNAYLVRYEGEMCVYAEARQSGGNLEKYWISVNDGLLRLGQVLKGDKVVSSVSAITINTDAQTDDHFTLPDKTVVK